MPAHRIHGRDDLIRLITGKGLYTACNRAIDLGNVEVLGGFSPPGTRSYWAVRIWSKHNKQWFMRISTTEDEMNYTFEVTGDGPDWAWWDGDADKCSSLIEGDMPDRNGELQIAALEEIINGKSTGTN